MKEFKVGQIWLTRNMHQRVIVGIDGLQTAGQYRRKRFPIVSANIDLTEKGEHDAHGRVICSVPSALDLVMLLSEPKEKFAVGQVWRQRNGKCTRIEKIKGDETNFPIITVNIEGRLTVYTRNGFYCFGEQPNEYDLIELVTASPVKVESAPRLKFTLEAQVDGAPLLYSQYHKSEAEAMGGLFALYPSACWVRVIKVEAGE